MFTAPKQLCKGRDWQHDKSVKLKLNVKDYLIFSHGRMVTMTCRLVLQPGRDHDGIKRKQTHISQLILTDVSESQKEVRARSISEVSSDLTEGASPSPLRRINNSPSQGCVCLWVRNKGGKNDTKLEPPSSSQLKKWVVAEQIRTTQPTGLPLLQPAGLGLPGRLIKFM